MPPLSVAAKSLILNQLAQLTGAKTTPVSCAKVLLVRRLSATDYLLILKPTLKLS